MRRMPIFLGILITSVTIIVYIQYYLLENGILVICVIYRRRKRHASHV